MAITHVNSVSLNASGSTSATITIPAGTGIQANDLLVACCVGNGTHVANGMTVKDSVNNVAFNVLLETDESSSSSYYQETKYYQTPGAIADGSTITVTGFASAAATSIVVDIFRGCTGAIDQAAVGQANAASTSIVCPALGANATAGSLVLSLAAGGGAFSISQSTMTTGSTNTANRNNGIAYVLSASGSSTYSVTWTQGTSSSWAGQTVSFTAAASGPGASLTAPNLALAAPALGITAGATVALTTPNLALAAPLISPAGSPTPSGLAIVNQWGLSDNNGYMPLPVPVTNTEGNALVAIIATGSDNVSGFVPRVSVSDDAHNWWTLVASETATFPGANRRLDVWVCAKARAASVISVTIDQIYSGTSGFIAEVSGAPAFINVDFTGTDGVGFGTATTLTGTATTADLVMSALALYGSGTAQSVTYPPSLTTTFTSISTSASGGMADVQLYAAYNPNIVLSGAVSESWSWGSNADIAGVVVGFKAAPSAPLQPNPKAPAVITEAAFGFPPDDQTGFNPTWTDLSARTIDDEGQSTIRSVRGRDYELTQPEAGELDILFNNQDGALNPTDIPYGLALITNASASFSNTETNGNFFAATPGQHYSGGYYVWANMPWPAGVQVGVEFMNSGAWVSTPIVVNQPVTTTPQIFWVSNSLAPAGVNQAGIVFVLNGTPPVGFILYAQQCPPQSGSNPITGNSFTFAPDNGSCPTVTYGTWGIPPYYPNVLPEVPVRSSFYWNGSRYGLGFSNATSWPQDFPAPQWGFVPYTGKDGIGLISQGSMPSAYGGEVLADFAATYYTLGEYYNSPHGSQFSNSSRFNQRPMIGWSPTALTSDFVLGTGAILGLLGDPASGIGVSAIQGTDTSPHAMGGAFVTDNSLPQFYNGAGSVAYEFWTTGASAGIAATGPALLTGYGKIPWNYVSGTSLIPGEVFSIYAAPASGGNVQWFLQVSSRVVTTTGTPGSPVTVTLSGGGGNWTAPTATTGSFLVECVGGGSGGAGSNAGGGGAGGAYAASTLSLTGGSSYPWSSGAGGARGTPGYAGGSGGDSSFNSGAVYAQGAKTNGLGIGVGGQASASTGSTKFNGGNGGTAVAGSGGGGAGGGAPASSAGAGANGQNNSGATGGNGGTGFYGSGGRGGNNGASGANAIGWAAGGGGAGAGGSGGWASQGFVNVTYTPTYPVNSSQIANVSGTSKQAAVYHVVLTVVQVSSNYVFKLYVNGVPVTSATITAPTDLSVGTLALGGATGQGGANIANNYAVGQLAVYPATLPPQRILSHYNTGLYARLNQNGDTTSQRVSSLFQWSGLGVPYGVAAADSMAPSALGNADQIQGTALADALYALALEEGGTFYCPATANGEVWYAPRQTLYNKTAKAVLGDSPTDVDNINPNFLHLTGWTLTSLTGTDAADSTVPGGHSATFTVSGTPTRATAFHQTAVTPGATYMLTGYIQPLVATTNLYAASIDWYTAAGGYISTSSSSTSQTFTAGVWTLAQVGTMSVPVTAPPTAAFARFGPAPYVNTGTLVNGSQFRAGQFWLTCVSSEIPYDAGSGFDFSDTYIFNIVSSQRTVSMTQAYFIDQTTGLATPQTYSTLGATATAADLTSETQYFPRGPLSQPVETISDQDAYDRASWTLAQYKQPQLRANQVSIDLATNPGSIDTVMRLEQGSVVTVNRRPLGAPMLSLNCMIQKIEVHVGPNVLTVILTLSPYFPSGAVLQLDGGTNATLGNTALPW